MVRAKIVQSKMVQPGGARIATCTNCIVNASASALPLTTSGGFAESAGKRAQAPARRSSSTCVRSIVSVASVVLLEVTVARLYLFIAVAVFYTCLMMSTMLEAFFIVSMALKLFLAFSATL